MKEVWRSISWTSAESDEAAEEETGVAGLVRLALLAFLALISSRVSAMCFLISSSPCILIAQVFNMW